MKKLTQAQSEATLRFIVECLLKDCDIIIQTVDKKGTFEDMIYIIMKEIIIYILLYIYEPHC